VRQPRTDRSETGAGMKHGRCLPSRHDGLRRFRRFELLPLAADMRLKRFDLALHVTFGETLQKDIERTFKTD